jgi:hypothetical protein
MYAPVGCSLCTCWFRVANGGEDTRQKPYVCHIGGKGFGRMFVLPLSEAPRSAHTMPVIS